VLTITVVNGAADNYVTVYPTGISRPDVSNLNMSAMHEEVANLATVRLGSSGSVDVESYDECVIIVDVAGYYEPVTTPVSEGRYVSLDEPIRVLDSRHGGMVKPGAGDRVVVDLTSRVPADATAAVVNLTTTGTDGRGFFTCFPLGLDTVPDSSNLNVDGPDQTRAAAAVVRIGSVEGRRGFQVWTHAGGHVIVDLLGYYTGSSAESSADGLFVPANPVRIVDTRKPTPARLWRNWMIESTLPGPAATAASAVVLNVTAVDALGWGYLTVSPARSYRWSPSRPPGSSSVNHTQRGQVVANQVITRVTAEHGLSVYASEGCHVLVDYSGYFTGTPRAATTAAPSNPTPQSAGPEWLLRVPRLGVQSRVLDGDSVTVTDDGHTWHWTGTGDMGQTANVALFAHRTSAGGPFRNIHLLEPGDVVEVVTSDNRLFEYEVVNRVLTSDERDDILNGSRAISPSSVALIACSRENFLPTSLDYRIVVNAKLVRWSEF
jgi:sortase (surface protein transpeptidase)